MLRLNAKMPRLTDSAGSCGAASVPWQSCVAEGVGELAQPVARLTTAASDTVRAKGRAKALVGIGESSIKTAPMLPASFCPSVSAMLRNRRFIAELKYMTRTRQWF